MDPTIRWLISTIIDITNNGGHAYLAIPHGERPGMQIIIGKVHGMNPGVRYF